MLARAKLKAMLTDPETGQDLADKLAGRTAKAQFEKAERYLKRERADDARENFQEVIDKWPYTSWAARSREALAALDK